MSDKRKVCIATGTRAEWGLLSGVARELAANPGIDLQIIATNMHLDPRYGMTVNEITADGFTVDERVPIPPLGDSEADRARAMAMCALGFADAFERLSPDLIVILGDRFEMLAVASVATIMRIPIVHIAGGEITRGAIDDAIRHAITKMASLHLTSTADYKARVIAMGEEPKRVINTGAIGVYNAMNEKLMSQKELEESLGFELGENTLLVTMHPVTMDPTDSAVYMQALLDSLNSFKDYNILFTYPNNDARGEVIINMINEYAEKNPGRVHVVPSLGKVRYLSALKCVRAVVGKVSGLSDISIYTDTEEVPLYTVLNTIKEQHNAEVLDLKALGNQGIKEVFEKALPEYDRDRVYAGDMKKVLQWYNTLIKAGITDFIPAEESEEAEDEEAAEESK